MWEVQKEERCNNQDGRAIEQASLDTLMRELRDLEEVDIEDKGWPAWAYVLTSLAALGLVIGLVHMTHGKRGLAKRAGGGRSSGAAAETPGVPMGPVSTAGGGDAPQLEGWCPLHHCCGTGKSPWTWTPQRPR